MPVWWRATAAYVGAESSAPPAEWRGKSIIACELTFPAKKFFCCANRGQAIPPPLHQLYSIGANQTVINSLYPKLVPLINTANKLQHPSIDVFTAMGGASDWAKTFPASCTLATAKTYPPCGWWCDAQSCDQCHPNNAGYTVMAAAMMKGIGL